MNIRPNIPIYDITLRPQVYYAVLAMGIVSWILGCRNRDQTSSATQPTQTAAVASGDADYAPADVYSGLRCQVLALKPNDHGLSDRQPFAVLMETGYEEAVATLAVIADGTTSLYFSNGGGVIGAGQHAAVRKASSDFLPMSLPSPTACSPRRILRCRSAGEFVSTCCPQMASGRPRHPSKTWDTTATSCPPSFTPAMQSLRPSARTRPAASDVQQSRNGPAPRCARDIRGQRTCRITCDPS